MILLVANSPATIPRNLTSRILTEPLEMRICRERGSNS